MTVEIKKEVDWDKVQTFIDETFEEHYPSLFIHDLTPIYDHYHYDLKAPEQKTIKDVLYSYFAKNKRNITLQLSSIGKPRDKSKTNTSIQLDKLRRLFNLLKAYFFVGVDLENNKVNKIDYYINDNQFNKEDISQILTLSSELGIDVSAYEIIHLFGGPIDLEDSKFRNEIESITSLALNEIDWGFDSIKTQYESSYDKVINDINKQNIYFDESNEVDKK
ncbi:hypothetical protein AAGG74_16290 [Bacillus mexicanus]|uniref:hypothetical protein n=1 Tax=Bacillus mexicanus TaxID=2834415 RepID=UPI003D218A7F